MSNEDKVDVAVGPAKVAASGKNVARIGSSIADLLSPFAEGMGLIGDHIRVYRERSVSGVLERAQSISRARGEEIKPVHPKNLVPLLENASLDDSSEDAVTDMWSRLLLSGDELFDAEMAMFADSLKRIGKREADFLLDVCTKSSSFPIEPVSDRFGRNNEQFVSALAKRLEWKGGEAQLYNDIESFYKEVGMHYGKILYVAMYESKSSDSDEDASYFDDGLETARLLEREQLTRVKHVESISKKGEVMITYCELTLWGVRLIRRCYPENVARAEAREASRQRRGASKD